MAYSATFDDARVPDSARMLERSEACSPVGKWAFVLLWVFILVDLVRPEDIFHVSFHLQLIFGAAAAVAFVYMLATRRVRLLRSSELALLFLLTLWFTVGVSFAYWRTESFQLLTQVWYKTFLIFLLLSQVLTTVSRIRNILWAVVLGELIVTIISVARSGDAALHVGDRVAGVSATFLGWNFFGIAMAFSIPYIGVLYVSSRSIFRTALLLVSLGVMAWMLVLTASRGGFLDVTFSVILTYWFVLRGSARGRIASLILIALLSISIAKAPDVFFARLQTVLNGSEVTSNETLAADESTEGREFLLQRALDYTLANPMFGVGLGNFAVINGTDLQRSDAWFTTHNAFTQVSSEAGIPALFLFLALFATVLKHMKRVGDNFENDVSNNELRLLARATVVSALALGFGGLFANLAYDHYFYYPAAISAALWTLARQTIDTPQLQAQSPETCVQSLLSNRNFGRPVR
jgi:putative inorganic carbon (HCO3(-)) transporter